MGNLKVDAVSSSVPSDVCPKQLRNEFGFAQDSLIIAGISTWPGEEELLIETMELVRVSKLMLEYFSFPGMQKGEKRLLPCSSKKE